MEDQVRHHHAVMPPCYYVFDRRGKWVRLRTEDFAKDEDLHAQLDKVVERMLSEK
ncbi:MAG: hypothetical protein HYR84_02355 [Planctomycetes bacterium]|nr:hypothetical protein [Planctomycetota bacterium]